ncbi:unnamed protein product [Somion occarium]|uniref:Survival protein SurE-like phosphatase/nucleotidase domain-containing protein n=1 Tax=Somion occarium TaxID=3059160 RepID=A0ABP1E860_9APHY
MDFGCQKWYFEPSPRSPMPTESDSRLRVLLTNDDGPPGKHSPYIYGLFRHLTVELGWDVKVVIPSSQKSWIGNAYQITGTVCGRYYYPREPDGLGVISERSRSLEKGETAEWVLLDSTPATCANIALHNLYPGQIDLLISGPNLGCNDSAAFALSSGTIGAALSSSLSKVRSIALSYGAEQQSIPEELYKPAHVLSSRVIRHIWEHWAQDKDGLRDGEVDLYSINIPMVRGLLSEEGLKICWTNMWRNSYGHLFKAHANSEPIPSPAGPDLSSSEAAGRSQRAVLTSGRSLTFEFAHVETELNPADVPVGTDSWALIHGNVSVTPLRASLAEPSIQSEAGQGGNDFEDGDLWMQKL